MEDNIKYAHAWRSSRRQDRFTAYGAAGDEYSFTIKGAPKNIKTIGGAVKYLHERGAHSEAYGITRALREMEARQTARNS